MSRFAQYQQQLAAIPVMPPPQRRGLFGGLRNFAQQAQQPGGFVDRLQMFGASMQDIGQLDGVNRAGRLSESRREAQQAALEREQQAARQAATAQLNGLFGGAGPGAGTGARGGIPSVRDAAPALMALAQAGGNIAPYTSLFEAAQPDVAFERGFRYDRRDPNSAPDYAPQLGEGQAPQMQGGRVQSVGNIPGYAESRAVVERGVNDARNASTASYAGVQAENTARGTGRGSAPYDVMTVEGPSGPITASRETFLGNGPIYGQSESDRAYGVASATNRATREDGAETRASAAERLLPSLDRMEALLPDVIAGYGADQRLLASRALAATGNERAIRESTATQVFQNEARQVVAQVIRAFGANPTEGERKYAEQMSGADVNYTPEALQEGIRLARARAERDRFGSPSAQSGGVDRSALEAEARRRGLIQ
jgi:hypothetical protein